MAINWKYIKGMTNNCTSWIEFSNETYSESTDTTNYAPVIKYYNTDKERNPVRELNNRFVGASKSRLKLKETDDYDYKI